MPLWHLDVGEVKVLDGLHRRERRLAQKATRPADLAHGKLVVQKFRDHFQLAGRDLTQEPADGVVRQVRAASPQEVYLSLAQDGHDLGADIPDDVVLAISSQDLPSSYVLKLCADNTPPIFQRKKWSLL